MALQEAEINQVTSLITSQLQAHFGEWLADHNLPSAFSPAHDTGIRERIVRVEEELRHQRELMQRGFDLMEKRFDLMEKRFEQVDKRFVAIQEDMNKRFEQADKRSVEMREGIEKRSDARFEALTRRIDRFMIWSFSITIASAGTIITVLKLWK